MGNSPVCFQLTTLPDVQSPRLTMAFGQQAYAVAEQVVFDSLMLVASYSKASKNLVFTLRFQIDNNRKPRERLRLYSILATENQTFSPASFKMAIEILKMQLGTCFDVKKKQFKAESLGSIFDSFWNSQPDICHVGKREFIALDGKDGGQGVSARSGIRSNDTPLYDGVRGVYLPWPYHTDSRTSASDALFWDRLLDVVAPAGQPDPKSQFCVDLVFRPLELEPDDNVWAGLSAQLSRNRNMSSTRTATADMADKMYQEYWDLCAQGNLFEFGMRVAGTNPETVEWLAGSLATALTAGGRFKLDPLKKGSKEWTASIQAAQDGTFFAGFVEPDLSKLDNDKRPGVEYWSQVLNTPSGQELKGTMQNIPKLSGLAHLKHIVGPDTAREFLRLPIPRQGYLKTILLDTEVRSPSDLSVIDGEGILNSTLQPGRGGVIESDLSAIEAEVVLGQETEREGEAKFPLKALRGHMFVAGATGSGKTTTLYHLLSQLWEQHRIPFLVIEPVKKQYRALKLLEHDFPKLSKDLIVYTAGQSLVTPLRFNPLRFGAVTRNEHLGMLETCFRGSMPFWGPLPAIFLELLETQYRNKGFTNGFDNGLKSGSGPRAEDQFPLISDMVHYWKCYSSSIMESIGYAGEVEANIRGALIARMKELEQPYLTELFTPPELFFPRRFRFENQPKRIDLPLEVLLTKPVILELDALNQRQANLVTLFMLAAIREYRRSQGQTGELCHVLVIEEAHNLVGRSDGPVAREDYADPMAAATQFLVQMLAEVRALGQGLVIIDQTPAAVAPEVLKNTNLKLVQRTTDGEDRAALATNMLLSEGQTEEIARLRPGFGYFYQPDLYRPVGIKVEVSKPIKRLPDATMEDQVLRGRQIHESLERLRHNAAVQPKNVKTWEFVSSDTKFDLYMTMLHGEHVSTMMIDEEVDEYQKIRDSLIETFNITIQQQFWGDYQI